MPNFDSARLKNQIINNLMKAIRKDASLILDNATHKIEEVAEELGGSKKRKSINRSFDGAVAEVRVEIPEDKTGKFIEETDAIVKDFKFGNWSDMEIK